MAMHVRDSTEAPPSGMNLRDPSEDSTSIDAPAVLIKMKFLSPLAMLPVRNFAVPWMPGYDLTSVVDMTISPCTARIVNIGLRMELPRDMFGWIHGPYSFTLSTDMDLNNRINIHVVMLEPGWKGRLTVEIHNLHKEKEVRVRPGDVVAHLVVGQRRRLVYSEFESHELEM